jgi:hypothetical protein
MAAPSESSRDDAPAVAQRRVSITGWIAMQSMQSRRYVSGQRALRRARAKWRMAR